VYPCKVAFTIAIFLQSVADKIVEVLIKNPCFQYDRSLATQSGAIFITLRPRAIQIANHRNNAGGNDMAITSRINKNGVKNRDVPRALEIQK
jgi:hypothetical protein